MVYNAGSNVKKRLIRCVAGSSIVALLAVSCSSGTGSEGPVAEAESAAATSSFCSAVGELEAALGAGLADPVERNRAQQAAIEAGRRATANAPASLPEYFAAVEQLVLSVGIVASTSGDARSAARADGEAAAATAMRADESAVLAYVEQACGDRVFAGVAPLALQLSSGGAASAPVAPLAPPTTEVSAGGVTEVGFTVTGTTIEYERATISVIEARATNDEDPADPAGVPGDQNYLILELDILNPEPAANRFNAVNFQLIDPAGRPVVATFFFRPGSSSTLLDMVGRDSALRSLLVRTDTLVTDLSGWSFGYADDDRVPSVTPFGVESTTDYPILLEPGPSVEITETDGDCTNAYEVSVVEAVVALDSDVPFNDYQRVVTGTRVVDISVDLMTLPEPAGSACFAFQLGIADDLDWRLLIDGRAVPVQTRGSLDTVPLGTNLAVDFIGVPLPVDATELVFVGDNDEVIDTWMIDLPLVFGEDA